MAIEGVLPFIFLFPFVGREIEHFHPFVIGVPSFNFILAHPRDWPIKHRENMGIESTHLNFERQKFQKTWESKWSLVINWKWSKKMVRIWVRNYSFSNIVCPDFTMLPSDVIKTKPDFIVDSLTLALMKSKSKVWKVFEFAISF